MGNRKWLSTLKQILFFLWTLVQYTTRKTVQGSSTGLSIGPALAVPWPTCHNVFPLLCGLLFIDLTTQHGIIQADDVAT